MGAVYFNAPGQFGNLSPHFLQRTFQKCLLRLVTGRFLDPGQGSPDHLGCYFFAAPGARPFRPQDIEKEVPNPRAGVPEAYLEFKEKVPELKLKLAQGESIAATLNEFEVKPLDLKLQMELQLTALELGLETITS